MSGAEWLAVLRAALWWRRERPIKRAMELRRWRKEVRKAMEGKKTWTGLLALFGASAFNRYGISEADMLTLVGQISDLITQAVAVGGAIMIVYGKIDAVRRARAEAKAAVQAATTIQAGK